MEEFSNLLPLQPLGIFILLLHKLESLPLIAFLQALPFFKQETFLSETQELLQVISVF